MRVCVKWMWLQPQLPRDIQGLQGEQVAEEEFACLKDYVSSSCSVSCSKRIFLSFLILVFPKNLRLGRKETALKSFMKEVPAGHKLEQFNFGSLSMRQKFGTTPHPPPCRSPAFFWPEQEPWLCLLPEDRPGGYMDVWCLVFACCPKIQSSSPLER